MKISVQTATAGQLGFDMNQKLSEDQARVFLQHGFDFAIRYIRRSATHDYDLSYEEVTGILRAGLGLMVVQHVAPEGWLPSAELGGYYGQTAVQSVRSLHLPLHTMVWLDLEGVSLDSTPAEVIAYCNAWFNLVSAAGFTPGLYVGDRCGLTADALYHKLKFQRYWSAYNLNADQIPTVRGVCMIQRVAKESDRIAGIQRDGFDVDLIQADSLGGLPSLLFGRPD